ncbi:MAG: exodeoxyribonuclease VII large subunit [Verrucomicrobia bacterium]|nr:exodeoxyribonuclease VII large subunit [Verrucomicrobiota bacterium]
MRSVHRPAVPPRALTVSALTAALRSLVEAEIGVVWVEGEVSNLRRQASGHVYFTLKDEGAQIACVMFRMAALTGGGRILADGARIQLQGELSVYEARGQLQLIVRLVQPRGLGALQARFEALKAKLAAEGLFDPARKVPLPALPTRIGLVTSPTGAALQDMLQVFERRAPYVRLLVHPVRVQGEGAAAEIARAIQDFDRWAQAGSGRGRVDVIIVARGGGSLEDLWEFNEEVVARAVAACRVPIVSAVGHEIDFTICDFAADVRAPTPSAAAEQVAPEAAGLRLRLAERRERLQRRLRSWVEEARARLEFLRRGELARGPRRRLGEERQRLDLLAESLQRSVRAGLEGRRAALGARAALLQPQTLRAATAAARLSVAHLRQRLEAALRRRLEAERARLSRVQSLLRVLGPQATLERGYSITLDPAGQPLTSVAQAPTGTRLRTRLADGEVESEVIGPPAPTPAAARDNPAPDAGGIRQS